MTDRLDFGKLPPQDLELEEAIIGACMLESTAYEKIQDILTSESFYKDSHQKIFESITKLYSAGKAIDILTVTEQLRSDKIIESVGGLIYLTGLTDRINSSAHIEFHARIVQQKFIRREFIRVATEIQKLSYDDSVDINDLIDFSENNLSKITTVNVKKLGRFIGEIGKNRLKKLEQLSTQEIKFTGVPCWDKFNKFTGGWQPKNSIIIAARPGMGKTRLSQEMAKIAAVNGNAVAFFSLEMADEELYDRQLASETGFENMTIRQANFKDDDWTKIENAQRKIEQLPIIIDDTPALTVNEFKQKARLYKRKYNIKLIIIDYLQLMRSPEYKKFKEQEIADISRTIKLVAKELDIPIITLSQLSRKIEDRHDKTPLLSDLRDSGSIEQDADIVAFIHLPEVYEKEKTEENKNVIEFIFAKHRHGAVGNLKLYRSDRWSTIYENKRQYEQDNINDVPY